MVSVVGHAAAAPELATLLASHRLTRTRRKWKGCPSFAWRSTTSRVSCGIPTLPSRPNECTGSKTHRPLASDRRQTRASVNDLLVPSARHNDGEQPAKRRMATSARLFVVALYGAAIANDQAVGLIRYQSSQRLPELWLSPINTALRSPAGGSRIPRRSLQTHTPLEGSRQRERPRRVRNANQ